MVVARTHTMRRGIRGNGYRIALHLMALVPAAVAVAALLFLPLVTRQDELLVRRFSLTGLQIAGSMARGGMPIVTGDTQYMLHVPLPLSAMVLLVVAVQGAGMALGLSGRKRMGGLCGAACALCLAGGFALLMMTHVVSTRTLAGTTVPFFQVYQVGVGYVVALLGALVSALVGLFLGLETMPLVRKFWFMYLLLLIPMAIMIVFSLYPVLLQTVLSFKEYRLSQGVWGSSWVGLTHFARILSDPDMGRIIANTLYISVLRLLVGFLPPIVLALCIYEMTRKWIQRAVQTITYLPHFFSWVIIYAIAFAFLSPNGIINNGIIDAGRNPVDFLTTDRFFMPIVLVTAIWKEIGWGTILFLAALTSVDTEMYDSAALDGAGPLHRLWHITLPQISSIIVFMIIMSVGNILKGAGGEQLLLFSNAAVQRQAEVIDTWVYWQGLGKLQYGLSAAVSFFQSGIGVVMVLLANRISIRVTGRGMW